jgi:hypothetical protein
MAQEGASIEVRLSPRCGTTDFEDSRYDLADLRTDLGSVLSHCGGTATIPTDVQDRFAVELAWQARSSAGVPMGERTTIGWFARFGAFRRSHLGPLAIAVAAVGGGWDVFCLVLLIIYRGDYRSVTVAVLCWLVFFGVWIALVAMSGRRMSPFSAGFLCLAVVAFSLILSLDCDEHGLVGFANWSWGVAGWVLALLVVHGRLGLAIAGTAGTWFTEFIVASIDLWPDRSEILRMAAIVFAVSLPLGAALAALFLLRSFSERIARLDTDKIAANEAADKHAAALAESFSRDTIRLLSTLGGRGVDPAPPELRDECRAQADLLRSWLVPRDQPVVSDDLTAFQRVAYKAGLLLEETISCNLRHIPREVSETIWWLFNVAVTCAEPTGARLTIFELAGTDPGDRCHVAGFTFDAQGHKRRTLSNAVAQVWAGLPEHIQVSDGPPDGTTPRWGRCTQVPAWVMVRWT